MATLSTIPHFYSLWLLPASVLDFRFWNPTSAIPVTKHDYLRVFANEPGKRKMSEISGFP